MTQCDNTCYLLPARHFAQQEMANHQGVGYANGRLVRAAIAAMTITKLGLNVATAAVRSGSPLAVGLAAGAAAAEAVAIWLQSVDNRRTHERTLAAIRAIADAAPPA
jgi:hypothetical protein